jgi:hypothetical protein
MSTKRVLTLPRMPGVNRQGQAHIVSTAILSPRSGKGSWEVEATPWFRTWFSIDPQPASISPTINISTVFICAFFVDCGRITSRSAIRNDPGAILGVGKGRILSGNCHEKLRENTALLLLTMAGVALYLWAQTAFARARTPAVHAFLGRCCAGPWEMGR